MGVVTTEMLEQQLLHLHTAFFGKITKLGEDCKTATVQPLDMLKPIGSNAKKQAVVSDIPVLEHARYRLVEEERICLIDGNSGCTCEVTTKVTTSVTTSVSVNTETGNGTGTGTGTGTGKGSGTVKCSCQEETRTHLKKEPIKVGDICFCVCCERDNTETRKGKTAVPILGHHNIKDAVVVGVL